MIFPVTTFLNFFLHTNHLNKWFKKFILPGISPCFYSNVDNNYWKSSINHLQFILCKNMHMGIKETYRLCFH